MATEIVILVGNTIGGTITEINGDAVADVDHDVIDNMDGRHTWCRDRWLHDDNVGDAVSDESCNTCSIWKMAGIAIWKVTLVTDMESDIARDTSVTFVGGVDAGYW